MIAAGCQVNSAFGVVFMRIIIANYCEGFFTHHFLSEDTVSTWCVDSGIIYPAYNDTVEIVNG